MTAGEGRGERLRAGAAGHRGPLPGLRATGAIQAEGWPARSWQQDGLLVEDADGRRVRGGGGGGDPAVGRLKAAMRKAEAAVLEQEGRPACSSRSSSTDRWRRCWSCSGLVGLKYPEVQGSFASLLGRSGPRLGRGSHFLSTPLRPRGSRHTSKILQSDLTGRRTERSRPHTMR